MKDIRVLIVEDEVLIAQQLKRKLVKLGYQISGIAASCDEAIRILRQNQANIVLMDIVIKGSGDGIDAAVRMQNDFNLPVIFLTAYADDKTLERAEMARAYGYLIKPVQEPELHAMIKIVLNRHERDLELLNTIASVEQMGQILGATARRLSKQVTDYGKVSIEDELKYALDREQFELHYQPKVSLKSRCIVGAEALIRWNHPTLGQIAPANFIPQLEETGMIYDVGEWVMYRACSQLKQWSGLASQSFRMSVNLSSKQIRPKKLAKLVNDCLSYFQLNPEDLELEITESIIMSDLPDEIAVLRELKEIGVILSMDDFGTGYSGLSYLQNFPFDIIKIDRAFVHNVTLNNKFTAIILSIINLARSLDMQTIVEGVETREELEFLKAHQCDLLQGFYFSPAINHVEFSSLLQAGWTFDA